MLFFHQLLLLLLSYRLIVVNGWGEYGHEIVANIAWYRLSDSTREQITTILNITNATTIIEAGSPLAAVANWADHVRYYMPWSGGLHYIDIRDDSITGGCHYHPIVIDGMNSMMTTTTNNLTTTSSSSTTTTSTKHLPCDFTYERDCPNDYCVAGAIVNYSSQLLQFVVPKNEEYVSNNKYIIYVEEHHQQEGHTSLRKGLTNRHSMAGMASKTTTTTKATSSAREALMFLIHFIGDIHQPLHASRSTDKGGNDIHVLYHLLHEKENALPSSTIRHSFNQDRSTSSSNNSTTTTTDNNHVDHHNGWNLHSVWDTALIETTLDRDYNDQRTKFEKDLLLLLQDHPEWEQHYLSCDDDRSGIVSRHYSTSLCVQEWGQESWQLALQFAYTKNIPEQDGGVVIEVVSGDELDEEYYVTRLPVVKERLIAGGVRLAATLEDIFGNGGNLDSIKIDSAVNNNNEERQQQSMSNEDDVHNVNERKNLAHELESLRVVWASISRLR